MKRVRPQEIAAAGAKHLKYFLTQVEPASIKSIFITTTTAAALRMWYISIL